MEKRIINSWQWQDGRSYVQAVEVKHAESTLHVSRQAAVHINHLNKVLKETTGKTTSALIAERVAQEARVLLRHTDWTVGEIAWCLGFDELPHFIHFFKKHVRLTPKSYRITDMV